MWQRLFTRTHKLSPVSFAQVEEKSSEPASNTGPQASANSDGELNGVSGLRYDFGLFRPRADEAPQVTAMRGHGGLPTTSPDPQKEALKRRVADALIAKHPQLRICQFNFDQIACFEHISVEEARRRHRHLELGRPEGGNGIEIVLHDDEATVSVPYWHTGEKAAEAFLELSRYLEIIRRETGYVVYDNQIGRMLAPTEDCTEALVRYNEIVRRSRREPRPAVAAERQALEILELAATGYAGAVMVAVRPDGGVCGFADISIRDNANMAYAYLQGWYVEPECRGRGVGGRLLQAVESWSVARGLTTLASDVKLDHARRARLPLLSKFAGAGAAARYIRPIPVSS
jgi:GNAT superfamily N-acetyltransferase